MVRFGDFTLLDDLGQSDAADHFRAMHDALGGPFFVKRYPRLPSSALPDLYLRCERLMLLRDERIVSHLGHGEVEGVTFVVSPWVEGFDLDELGRSLRDRRVALPMETLLFILREVALAIHALHRTPATPSSTNVLAHGEITTRHIRINAAGRVVLTGTTTPRGPAPGVESEPNLDETGLGATVYDLIGLTRPGGVRPALPLPLDRLVRRALGIGKSEARLLAHELAEGLLEVAETLRADISGQGLAELAQRTLRSLGRRGKPLSATGAADTLPMLEPIAERVAEPAPEPEPPPEPAFHEVRSASPAHAVETLGGGPRAEAPAARPPPRPEPPVLIERVPPSPPPAVAAVPRGLTPPRATSTAGLDPIPIAPMPTAAPVPTAATKPPLPPKANAPAPITALSAAPTELSALKTPESDEDPWATGDGGPPPLGEPTEDSGFGLFGDDKTAPETPAFSVTGDERLGLRDLSDATASEPVPQAGRPRTAETVDVDIPPPPVAETASVASLAAAVVPSRSPLVDAEPPPLPPRARPPASSAPLPAPPVPSSTPAKPAPPSSSAPTPPPRAGAGAPLLADPPVPASALDDQTRDGPPVADVTASQSSSEAASAEELRPIDPAVKALLERGRITASAHKKAVDEQRRRGGRVLDILVADGAVGDAEAADALADESVKPRISDDGLLRRLPASEVVTRLPATFALERKILPLRIDGPVLVLAVADPFDRASIDEAARIFQATTVHTHVATRGAIRRAIGEAYKKGPSESVDYRVLVCVADDDTANRIGTRLVQEGYSVELANALSLARRVLKDHSPDAAIIGAELQDGHGVDLVPEVRADAKGHDLPLFVVGPDDEELETRVLDLGGDDFFAEPLHLDVVVKKVRRALSKRQPKPKPAAPDPALPELSLEEPAPGPPAGAGGDSFGAVISDVTAEPTGVMGTLRQMAVPEIVQSLELGRKTARVEIVPTDGPKGVFAFRDGQIGFASRDDGLEGDDAFYALARYKEGFFRIHYGDPGPRQNIEKPTTFLLLEAMRLMDEDERAPGT